MHHRVTATDLRQLESYLDQVWSKLGVDVSFGQHFLDRVNDPRNHQPITLAELQKLFIATYQKYGRDLVRSFDGKDIEGVLRDVATAVNTPFILKWDGQQLNLVAKTVMRKKGFVPHSPKDKILTVEQKITAKLASMGL